MGSRKFGFRPHRAALKEEMQIVLGLGIFWFAVALLVRAFWAWLKS